jgi:hypothetical protein
MKTPVHQAYDLYAAHPDMDFNEDFSNHVARGGYVIMTPQVCVMARPIRRNWTSARIADTGQVEPRETADCWFVWLLCGSLKEAVKHLPYALPWVGFSQRGQPARFIELEKALAKIG